ncbi:MAG: class I SAM-dependent methyltransferase, partial [Planctomycetes bacterium]|nr:class I SAM-dependent methyltransferase [Planctomycetota bacterium]
FRAAIEDYGAGAREVVAVVGCGGSGLLYELSPLFEETAGVDISIPALLFAGRLLRGGELTLSFNFPSDRVPLEQTTVRLKGPKPRPSPIHLVAADASRLPFADASVSCVASQYLLDLMPDQRSLAAELHRVLVPGGLWLSFGLPGGLTSEDAAAHVDLSGFFSGVGFDLVKASRERCTHLDMSSLSRWRGTAIHCNEFAVWRKNPSTTGGRERAFADYFSGRGDSILRRQPSRSDRITISIASQRRFKAKSVDAVMRLAIHAGSEDLLALDLPAEAAGFLDEFFERIDGKRTIREIVESLRTTLGEFIHEKEIVLLIRTLCELGLLRVSVAPD